MIKNILMTLNLFSFLLTFGLLNTPAVFAASDYKQEVEHLIEGETMAIAYSGFRAGQHPDRGKGANNPSEEQILEDLNLLIDHNFKLIRLYDSGMNSAATLKIIKQHKLPIKVLLGIWLEAEISNHNNCPWLNEPISTTELSLNKMKNTAEINRGINLANQFTNIIVAVNVGNEALVSWNDHMVPVNKVITYVQLVKRSIKQAITVADNYEWWISDGKALAKEIDFIGVHTYPAWENKPIEQALSYTIRNIKDVHQAIPKKPIVILEGGWATTATEFGNQASEANQKRYFNEIKQWAKSSNTTFFFFEAFDEPWKGNPNKLNGAEKHWGLFNVDRTPKKALE
jgi:exo-beta-1,3-glucanase (GH17 family)